MVVLDGNVGQDVFNVSAAELPDVTLYGNSLGTGGLGDRLNITTGGVVNLNNLASGWSTGVATLNLSNQQTFLTLDGQNWGVGMGTNADTVVVGGAGTDVFRFGAAGQEAVGGSGNDTFTMTQAILDGAGTVALGGSGFNTLRLVGGGVGDASFDIGSAHLTGISSISVDGAASDLYDFRGVNYVITAGSLTVPVGADIFDLTSAGCLTTLTTMGGGADTVYIGSATQVVSLGSGANVVYIHGSDLKGHNAISGGSGASNVLDVYPDTSCDIIMGNKVVGFSIVNLDPNSDSSGVTFQANNTSGLTVNGTHGGGDTVTLGAASQSFVGGVDYFENVNVTSNNTVILNGGGLATGVTLNGGGGACNVLDIALGGIYNFTTSNVSNFMTVNVDGNATTLTLNNVGQGGVGGGYIVNVAQISDVTTYTDNLTGGAGDDTFNINASGAFTGSITGGGGTDTINIDATVDLTGTTIAGIAVLNVNGGDAVTLKDTQFNVSDIAAVTGSGAVTIDVTGSSFNLADVSLASTLSSITIDASTTTSPVTIWAGGGVETIVLGSGADWVNLGSGPDTIVASATSGDYATIVGGASTPTTTIQFGTANSSMVTHDTIITTGATELEIVSNATVQLAEDFVNTTLLGVTTVQIDQGATLVLNDGELFGLNSNDSGLAIGGSGTLEIVGTVASTFADTVTTPNFQPGMLDGWTGQLVIAESPSLVGTTLAPIVIDLSALSNSSVTVDVGPGVETITGESTYNNDFVFAAGGATTDTITGGGNAATNTITVEATTDFTGATLSGIGFVNIYSQGTPYTTPVNATFSSAELYGGADGTVAISGGTTTYVADLTVNVSTASFALLDLGITSTSFIDLTFNTKSSSGHAVTLDLSGTLMGVDDLVVSNVWGGQTNTYMGQNINVVGGPGADTYLFNSVAPQTVTDTIVDAGGSNIIDVGSTASGGAGVNFLGANLAGADIGAFNIGNSVNTGASATLWSTQVEGTVVTNWGTVNIDIINQQNNIFSLVTGTVSGTAVTADLIYVPEGADSTTHAGSPAVLNIYADNNADTIDAGDGTENIYNGGGNDKITAGATGFANADDTVYLTAGGVDTVLGNSSGNSLEVVFNKVVNGGFSTADIVEGNGETTTIVIADATNFMPGAIISGVGTITVDASASFAGATTISGIGAITVYNDSMVTFTDTQLAAFQAAAPPTTLTAHDGLSDALTISVSAGATDVINNTLAGGTFDLHGWTGSVTVALNGGIETIATGSSGFIGNLTVTAGSGNDAIDVTGVTGNATVNGGSGNESIIANNSDALLSGSAGNNLFEFNSAGANTDIIVGAGTSNTLQIGASIDFRGATFGGSALTAIQMTVASDTATFYGEQVSGLTLAVTGASGGFDKIMIAGDGNVNLAKFNTSGFANISTPDIIQVNDIYANAEAETGTISHSVVVSAASAGADYIQVEGLGDTVRAGAGGDIAWFTHSNAANNFDFNLSALSSTTLAAGSGFAATGSVIEGLSNGFHGYVDVTEAPGLVFHGVIYEPGQASGDFLTSNANTGFGDRINSNALFTSASSLLSASLHTTLAGGEGIFVTWDSHHDAAMFLVNDKINSDSGSNVTAGDIQLMGVLDSVNSTANTLSSSFFHLHS